MFDLLRDSIDIDVIILTSIGPNFCTGIDLVALVSEEDEVNHLKVVEETARSIK